MLELIVDASVALKWFPLKGEQFIQEALGVWDKIQLKKIRAYAPLFMLVEIANVLARKKKVEAVIFKNILKKLADSEIVFVDLKKTDLGRLGILINKYGLTAYDAQYLLLARQLKCKLVSYDEELLKITDWVARVKDIFEDL